MQSNTKKAMDDAKSSVKAGVKKARVNNITDFKAKLRSNYIKNNRKDPIYKTIEGKNGKKIKVLSDSEVKLRAEAKAYVKKELESLRKNAGSRPSKLKRKGSTPRKKLSAGQIKHSIIQKECKLSHTEVKEWEATGVCPRPKKGAKIRLNKAKTAHDVTATSNPNKRVKKKQVKGRKEQSSVRAYQAEISRIAAMLRYFKKRWRIHPKVIAFLEREKAELLMGAVKRKGTSHKTVVSKKTIVVNKTETFRKRPMTVVEFREELYKNKSEVYLHLPAKYGIAPIQINFYDVKDGERVVPIVHTPRFYPRAFAEPDGTKVSPIYDPVPKQGKPIYGYVNTEKEIMGTRYVPNPEYGKSKDAPMYLTEKYGTGKFKKSKTIVGYKEAKNPLTKLIGLSALTENELLQLELLCSQRPDYYALNLRTANSECTIVKYLKGAPSNYKTEKVLDSKRKPVMQVETKEVVEYKKVSRLLGKKKLEFTEPVKQEKKTRKNSTDKSLVCMTDGVQVYRCTREKAAIIKERYSDWNYCPKSIWKEARRKGKHVKTFYMKPAEVVKEQPKVEKPKVNIPKRKRKPQTVTMKSKRNTSVTAKSKTNEKVSTQA